MGNSKGKSLGSAGPWESLGSAGPWEWNWDNTTGSYTVKIPTPESRIKPLALASGHGRYILHCRYTRTGGCVRCGMAVTYNHYKFVTVSTV
jgi:hypothetical protein